MIITSTLFFVSCVDKQALKKRGEAARNLGEAYINDGEYTIALRELLKAKEIYEDDYFLHYDLGIVYMAKEELDLAIKHFKRCVDLNPSFTDGWNSLGTAYYNNNELDLAIDCFERATGDLVYGNPHGPLSNLAWAHLKKKNFKAAEKYFKKAIKSNPKFANAYRGLGQTYMKQGKHFEAIDFYEKGIKIQPTFAPLHLDLGRAHAIVMEEENAISAFKNVLKIVPPDSPLAEEANSEIEKLKTGL